MVRSLAPACPWVSTCVVHLSTYCLPSGWHNVGPQHSVLETIFRLEDCHPPPWAELTDPVSLQEPSGLLTKHPVVSVCWGRKGIGEGHFLLLPCVGGAGRGGISPRSSLHGTLHLKATSESLQRSQTSLHSNAGPGAHRVLCLSPD